MRYMSERQFNQMVDFYIEHLQGNNLQDPEKRNEIEKDLIYIEDKIYLRGFVRLFRLLAIVAFVIYFVGQYWLIYVQVALMFSSDQHDHQADQDLLYY